MSHKPTYLVIANISWKTVFQKKVFTSEFWTRSIVQVKHTCSSKWVKLIFCQTLWNAKRNGFSTINIWYIKINRYFVIIVDCFLCLLIYTKSSKCIDLRFRNELVLDIDKWSWLIPSKSRTMTSGVIYYIA